MIPEIGTFSLILALALSVLEVALAFLPSVWFQNARMPVLLRAVYLQGALILLAFLCLVYAFVNNDFTVAYVTGNSNIALPMMYKISAVWGGHEGSLLLWILILSGWTVAVAAKSAEVPESLRRRVLGVLALIAIGFLLFILMTSNPFARLLPDFPMDGRDLNPLLQDFGLIVHPPLLYIGYVGFSVAFAFTIAGLLEGRLDNAWIRWTRPWTNLAWAFLTVGIALGSWWAYYELGWGGWWFWDPVENASFMPWLTGAALIHSQAATEKRGIFKNWTMFLAILAFSLSLLGTFLVRSGVLTSVHAFASDPDRGFFILVFLFIVVFSALCLLAWRAPLIRSAGNYERLSRESYLMLNNIILMIATLVVLMGTLAPLVAEAMEMKISVRSPYFNAFFVPLALLLVFLLPGGSTVHWKSYKLQKLVKDLLPSFIASMLMTPLMLWFWAPAFTPIVFLAISLSVWVILAQGVDLIKKLQVSGHGVMQGWMGLSRSYKGMALAHSGLAVLVIGICVVGTYTIERDVRIGASEVVSIADYEVKLLKVEKQQGPNYSALVGEVEVTRPDSGDNSSSQFILNPEKRYYSGKSMPMTEAAINSNIFRDVYVAIGEELDETAWSMRIYFKPFIGWLWFGALCIALGAYVASTDKRYKKIGNDQDQKSSK